MKLLYVHNSDFSTFSANKMQVTNMCNAFNKNKVETTLLSFKTKSNNFFKFNKSIKTIFLKPSKSYYTRTLQLFNKFRKLNYNFIFSRDLFFTYLTLTFYPKKHIIYELHQIPKNPIWKILFKLTFKKLKHLIVISEGIKEELIKQGFNKNKIIVFHDGVDLEKFNIKISQSEARKKLNLPLDNNVIIYVGSLQDWKGTPTLLSASKSFEKNTLLCIVGGNKDQILKLKTNYKNVLFKGNVINELIPFYLKAANILVLPNSSKFEISTKYTSPLKLFEYMASKKPIIASKLQSIKNIVSEKEVLFFKPDDSKDLNKQISSLLKNSKSQKELSENAFKKVKNFTWIERVKEILKVLKK